MIGLVVSDKFRCRFEHVLVGDSGLIATID